jgi:hypothetical protein
MNSTTSKGGGKVFPRKSDILRWRKQRAAFVRDFLRTGNRRFLDIAITHQHGIVAQLEGGMP